LADTSRLQAQLIAINGRKLTPTDYHAVVRRHLNDLWMREAGREIADVFEPASSPSWSTSR